MRTMPKILWSAAKTVHIPWPQWVRSHSIKQLGKCLNMKERLVGWPGLTKRSGDSVAAHGKRQQTDNILVWSWKGSLLGAPHLGSVFRVLESSIGPKYSVWEKTWRKLSRGIYASYEPVYIRNSLFKDRDPVWSLLTSGHPQREEWSRKEVIVAFYLEKEISKLFWD